VLVLQMKRPRVPRSVRAARRWGRRASELGTDVAGHDRLTDFDFGVEDLVRYEKLLSLLGNGETVFTGEGVRLDADPDEDGGDGLSNETDVSDVRAHPLHPP
jgi:hypothetical protein